MGTNVTWFNFEKLIWNPVASADVSGGLAFSQAKLPVLETV